VTKGYVDSLGRSTGNFWGGSDPANSGDSADYEMGLHIKALRGCRLTGVRIYGDANEPGLSGRLVRIWSTGGTQLASFSAPTDLVNGWQSITFLTPYVLAAGEEVVVSYGVSGNYTTVPSALTSATTDYAGVLLVPASGGRYNTTPGSYPNSTSTSLYGLDVAYDYEGAPAGTGGSMPVYRLDAYGTVGSSDDSATWTALMAAVGSTPCVIYVPAGTTTCDGDIIRVNLKQVLRGAGQGISFIKLKNSATSPRLVSTTDIGTLAGSMSNAGPYQFAIEDLTLEGNSANNTGIRPLGAIPSTPTFSTTTGTLAAGTYNYKVTAKTAFGETPASNWASHTLGATGGVVVNWTAVSGATGYNVYGRSWNQGGSGFKYIGTSATTSFTDSGSVTPTIEMNGRHDGTAGALLHIYGYNYTLRDVDCHDAPGMGFLLEWGDQVNGPAVGIDMEARLDTLRASECYSNGFAFYGPHDSSARNLLVAECAKQAVSVIDNWVLGNGPLNVDQVHTWGQCRYSQAIYGQGFIRSANAEGALTAQLFVYNGEVDWDGLVFYPGNATAKGVVIGDAQYSPSATKVTAKARQFGQNLGSYTSNGAAFDLTYLGNNSIFVGYSDQTAGTCIVEPTTPGNSDIQIVNAFDKATSARYSTQPQTYDTGFVGGVAPSAPVAGGTVLDWKIASGAKEALAVRYPVGLKQLLAHSAVTERRMEQLPGATTTPQSYGTTWTTTGTLSHPALASTSLATRQRQTLFSSGTTAGTVASTRTALTECWRGNAAGVGGFWYFTRFSLNTLQAGMRAFLGLADVTTAPTNVDPTTSTTPGKIGVAINTNSGNWNFVTNVTGTAPTVTALGASFPVDITSVYELWLYAAPNDSGISWSVVNVGTGAISSGKVTTNLPANTTFLAAQSWVTNNATAAAAILGINRTILASLDNM
jgi:hypothetical protein